MNETILGKITEVSFGVNDGRFGLLLTLSGSWSVMTTEQAWDPETVPPAEYAKWTIADQDAELAKICRKISKLLNEAKVSEVSQLLNIPIEFTSKGGILDSWRILTEVL